MRPASTWRSEQRALPRSDDRDELTDEPFPRQGSLGHAALLTIRELVQRHAPDQTGSVPSIALPAGALDGAVDDVAERYGHRFRQAYRDDRSALCRDVEQLLVVVDLLRIGADGTRHLRAVAARFAPEVTEISQPRLFQEVR